MHCTVDKKRESVLEKQNYWKMNLNYDNILPCEREKMLDVTQLPIRELLVKLNNEQLSCSEVLRAFVFRVT